MIYRRARFDVLICMGLAYLLSMGTGKVAELVAASTYESHVETHTVAPGEVGGEAGEAAFRAQSVADLLEHETFTVVSPGIEYRNRGAGYYGGRYLYMLTLPSGELVAADINNRSVQELDGSYYTGDNLLPVGRVVWEDLSQDESFLNQIQYTEPLTRTDFYIDMMGNGNMLNLESYTGGPVAAVQIVTAVLSFPLLHMLGSWIGLFPRIIPQRKKEVWE